MIEKNVMCPYCGAEMQIMVHGFYDGAYCSGYAYCPKCGSYGPSLAGDISKEQLHDEVKAATLRRPLQNPLTWADAMTLGVVWLEDNDKTICIPALVGHLVDDGIELFTRFRTIKPMMSDYGKRWRAWASSPTDEERAAAPWEGTGDADL